MMKTAYPKSAVSVALVLLGSRATAYADHPSISFGADTGGPITTISAATLPKGMKSIGVQFEYVKSKQFSDQQLLNLNARGIDAHSSDHLFSTSLGFGYGVTDDFTVGVRLPYIERSGLRAVDAGSGGVEPLGDSKGLGDLAVVGKYRIIHNVQGAFQGAVLFGLKGPTGATDKREQAGERFSTEHQPGSGSWDVLLGAAASKIIGRVSIDASALYAFAGNGVQNTRLGDRLQYSVAASYRLSGAEEAHEHGAGSKPHVHHHSAWDLVIELNGEWQGKQKIAGLTDTSSGGTLVYLSPGLRFSSSNDWAFNLSVGVPVVQNLRPAHADTKYRILSGFSKSF